MSKASSSILLLQRANNKRERKMLSDAFKVLCILIIKSSCYLYGVLSNIRHQFVQKADKNGDGKLSYEEYWHVIQKSRIK